MKWLAQFGKAAYGGIVASLGALSTVMVGDIGFSELSDGQWLAAILSGLIVAGGVWGIPYRAASSE